MSETWWKASQWGAIKIEPVEVLNSTEKFVALAGFPSRREAKGTTYYTTFSGARQYHMARLSSYISSRQADIDKAKADLNKVFMMEEPK